ncbi:MAG: hypothetical protein ASARMPRED_005540 [Alectoria sarmentosa]|nr:MAG: hypothetical protein ASARMPRED_005540 [Alectoria sarmentosa]
MADLLESLVLPNSSQESFHSSRERPSPSSPTDASANHDSAAPQSSSQSQFAALQEAGLPVYNVDAYLTAPENAALLYRAPDRKNAPTKQRKPDIDPSQPVSLGSKSSHRLTAFNELCQQKGLVPDFQIDGCASNADFGGLLKIGDATIASDERWHSKKEAREALAEKGFEAIKDMDSKRREPGTPGEKDKNWIGMLLEYHQFINPGQGPVYLDYSLGSSYSATCTIPSRPELPFGSSAVPFPSKKAARAHTARLAVEYLIAEGQLNPDGSPKARKKAKLGTAVRIQGKGLEVKRGSTYTQKVNDAYPLLGLQAPQYVLGASSPLTPNMLSGYASFPNEPGLPKDIGEVRNVFGKKNAKEEIAKGVWEVFRKLAEKRGVNISEIDGGGEDYEKGQQES